ncbi:MAG: thioredoxin family protein [Flavobacteriaceae bacterium]|nr:thioredoxin family protein [Flavobacteriaceae bacterium]
MYVRICTLLICFVVCSSFISGPSNAEDPYYAGMRFYEVPFEQAQALAKKENKMIYLDIGANWCGPCRMIKNKTYPNPKVGKYFNFRFISVMKDGERGEGYELAKHYKVRSYPTLLFLTPEGEVVKASRGYKNPEELLKFAEASYQKFKKKY